ILCEQNDLANATSSASTKLIHGGLRYLEHYQFGLVRKSLAEREILLKMAPHIIHPMRFILPHNANMRPAWLLRVGLFLYDHLSKRVTLPGHKSLKLDTHIAGNVLINSNTIGFEYSDCRVDDSRLVIVNAMSAADNGAEILTRMRCSNLERKDGNWLATLVSSNNSNIRRSVRCRVVVNATGPWVSDFQKETMSGSSPLPIRLVKGSHIVIPKFYDHGHAYIFQRADNRIVFAIPFETDFTLIGTTEVGFSGDASRAGISDDEIEYLCDAVSDNFMTSVSRDDIQWSFSGVRPLIGDEGINPSKLSRDYELVWTGAGSKYPLFSVYGGKITTYRILAEQVVRSIYSEIGGTATSWPSKAALPGGDLQGLSFNQFEKHVGEKYPWLTAPLCRRYARTYGSKMEVLIGGALCVEDLGQHFGSGLYAAEVNYLVGYEWAQTAEDILWRRTKLGLRLNRDEVGVLRRWMGSADVKSKLNEDNVYSEDR
ncbi:MAG: glycerol-3-phosphate dehydrogenase, partial [Rhodospirillales bacterium]|nr:glycerol-3-phosphate dehydrogenase [Rhodospirillales bacterium]